VPNLVGERHPISARCGAGRAAFLKSTGMSGRVARKWLLGGRIQGVGFRPFVYRLAQKRGITGWVLNRAGEVEIFGEGDGSSLSDFAHDLIASAPPLARPTLLSEKAAQPENRAAFEIRASDATSRDHVHLPPDQFACDDCLTELADPRNRRYRYPFINCTQCGPRYTLIADLPYDRANTAMAKFALCPDCEKEYRDPLDRRFHAEPIACPRCGPQLEFRSVNAAATYRDAALADTVAALRAGKIVAVKGVGGYHLLCDAANSVAVATLRLRKHRPDKPFAVMFPPEPTLATLRATAHLDRIHETLLRDPLRPIVLVPMRDSSFLAPEIAPGCCEIGAMLPYSPMHHALLQDFGAPLVATSGNLSGEPVLTDNAMAERRLFDIADTFLHHDRPILRPADDPVYRVIAKKPRPLRLGRGNAPLEIALPFALPAPILAVGGHLKNTIALGWEKRAVISPHLGDMDAPRSLSLLEEVAADLQRLYGVRAESIACDAHPAYATTRLAERWNLPVRHVFHHRAHATALAAEYGVDEQWLIFAWDGAGYGEDGTIWGGETLLGRIGQWQRVASWRPFSLLGGDRAAREPWRNALSLRWETGDAPPPNGETALLRQAWERGINCPRTSSVGRLFDAAAAFLGLCDTASYEGHAATLVEAAAASDASDETIPLPLRYRAGNWISDWQPLLRPLQDPSRSTAARASLFHVSLARAALDQAIAVRNEYGISRIGLTGGVFQNRLLCERLAGIAEEAGFAVFIPERLPCNDAGLSLGQLIEAAHR
jgi:hydrogenase maturation protein HypF